MPQPDLFGEQSERSARKTRAPENLNPAQLRRLEEWAEKTVPWISRGAFQCFDTLESHVEECLSWWRSEGRTKANWVATIQNRIRAVEKRRLQDLAKSGNADAALALRVPRAWAEKFDRAAKSAPATTEAEILRPAGGKVVSIRRAG